MKPFIDAALVLGLTFMAVQAFAAEELASIYVPFFLPVQVASGDGLILRFDVMLTG